MTSNPNELSIFREMLELGDSHCWDLTWNQRFIETLVPQFRLMVETARVLDE